MTDYLRTTHHTVDAVTELDSSLHVVTESTDAVVELESALHVTTHTVAAVVGMVSNLRVPVFSIEIVVPHSEAISTAANVPYPLVIGVT